MVEACAKAGVVLQVGFNQRCWAQVEIAKSLIDCGLHRQGPRLPLGLCRALGPLSGGDALSLRSETVGRGDDHRPHHPPHRPRPPPRRRLRRDRRRTDPQRDPRRGRRQCLAARPLRLRRARLAVVRPLLAGDRRRHRHLRHRGYDPHRHGNAESVPRRAARRLHRQVGGRSARRAARGALSRRLVEGLRGRLDLGQAAAAQSLRQAAGGFVSSIRAGKPAVASGLDGLRAQEVVQAAYLSQRDGWVDLPLPADAPFVLPSYR